MREIKFRAWDGKEMFYQKDNTSSAMWGLESFATKVGSVKGLTPEIMQYIGLKDKNGVEIYEGDILRNGGLVGVVEFGDFECDTGFEGHQEDWETLQAYYMKSKNSSKNNVYGEIIGNIYQNPELIK